ncbi:MAG: hypothetical protein U9N36_12310 [Euryarchaeota archaeon]|nr:hypothetical protein [Euryarchaeota archaeon]
MFAEAAGWLEEKRERLMQEWGRDPVPDEVLPPIGTLGFRIQRYNMNTCGDLFNLRQKLALVTFAEKVRQAHANMLVEGVEAEYAKAVASYIAILLDKMASSSNTIARW